ncbi:polysaccharide pyruvyl transferase family protein [Xanthobacter sediminis]|uniref:polysaccharide pyruvyl transferase family protein n=1 Tax=Xanthobacter sediminis TaxID=3119926 RepID=UPI003727DB58
MNLQNQESNWTKYDRTPEIFREVSALGPSPKILSFGCSTGEEVRTLRDKYFPYSAIHGIDIDREIIDSNQRNNPDPDIEYFSDPEKLDSDYDLIFCMSVLCRWPDRQDLYYFETFHKTLLSIDRRLKPGGLLVIYNGQFFLEETILRDHYEAVEIDHRDSGFVKKYHRDFSPFIGVHETTVYRKLSNVERRYGVIWANTENIGDDIQTLAAMHFLSKRGIETVECINREMLSEYNGGPLFVIMNGWFMHNIAKFPPPPTIIPIFISFHCADERLIIQNKEYFIRHSPIGCRDESTMNMFRKHGVPAYFTGCLTLGFDPVEKKSSGRFAVDINTCSYIPPVAVADEEIKDFVRLRHDLPEGADRDDIGRRLGLAKALLELYGSADLVVTTRLHCVLPCRAMGTRVKFVHANLLGDARFFGLHSVLAGASQVSAARETVPRERIDRVLENFAKIEI